MEINYEEIIKNVNVYGLEESIRGAKFPMSVDVDKLNKEVTPGILKLAQSNKGEGHDQFLSGIIVQFDLTYTVKAWTEMQRYHFFDFVSSQSTMHRITRFDLSRQYSPYTDTRIIDIMEELVYEYNKYQKRIDEDKESMSKESLAIALENQKERYLKILYSNPCGFKLTARITTNYRQLKTIYAQRKTHRLPEWRAFCKWVETLPHSEFILGTSQNQEK